MFKIQISLDREFDKEDFSNLEILSFKKKGSVAEIIIRGDKEKTKKI